MIRSVDRSDKLLDPRAIHIYTDGSCYGNPGGESGCAAIVHFPEHLDRPDEQIVDFGCAESSINRMELLPCIEALRWVFNRAPWKDVTRVLIVTDSQYVTNNVRRAPYWKQQGWKNQSGETKFNEDLWDHLLKCIAKVSRKGLRIDFVWEKGKKTYITKQIHNAAQAAAKRGGFDEDIGYRPGSVSRSMVKGGIAERFPASGQVVIIRPYVKKIMHKGENRISFNVFDEVTQGYANKFFAFCPPLLGAELHNGNGHRVRFNSDPKYPQLLERIEGIQLPKPQRKRRQVAAP
jgi:ribonuclease HI